MLILSVKVGALTSDGEQPLHIQADAAVMDDAKGSSVYRGNVSIEQGTLQIKADEVEIITSDSEVIQIIASADANSKNLVHFEQLPDDSTDLVYADARKITYLVQEERLHLSGNATLRQTKDVLTGELVYYDITQGIMSLKSGGQQDRIDVIINPKAK
jgi:lipopolysaccharide export system protein LptA